MSTLLTKTPYPEHRERQCLTAALLRELGDVLLKYRASIFFNDKPGSLWIAGEEYALIDHDPDGCGHTFVLLPCEKEN